jgi:drug/metabolite transporter superfamily protein YnfA
VSTDVCGQFNSQSQRRRARRVSVLLVGIIVLSLADLFVTIGHLRSTGMIEANPIAAHLIRVTHSPWVLAAYKCLTVGVCVTLLHRLRRRMWGEVGAWCAAGILTVMALLWHTYSRELESPARVDVVQGEDDGVWLQLD